MDLYVVRHGIAADVGEEGVKRDADRTLSDEGRRKTALAARGMAAAGVRADVVGTSPLPRAAETARIIAETVCPHAPVEELDFLAPGASAADVVEWLRETGAVSAMIVGHMPDVAEVTARLICDRGAAALTFKKAGVALVAFDSEPAEGEGVLEWLMQPRQLRDLAKRGQDSGKD